MRVSDRMISNQMIKYMNDTQAKKDALSLQVASGKLYENASDNPADVSAAMTIKSTLQTGKTYLENANRIDGWMDTSDQAFSQMSSLMIRATTLIQSGLSDTLSADERATSLAPEMSGILDEALDIANTTYLDQYIFSGYQVNTKPYEIDPTNSSQVLYHGDDGLMQHDIGTGQTVTTNVNSSSSMQAMFNAIIRARNALLSDDRTELEAALTDINNAQDTVGDLQATNGARMRQVDNAITYLEKSNLTLKSLLSEKEDVNMAEAIVNLTNMETTYEAVLEVGQRAISSLNLFDLLR